MKDFLGQELNVGDNVIQVKGRSTGLFQKGKVTGFTSQYVSIEYFRNKDYYGPGKDYIATENRRSDKVLKIDTILNNLDGNNKK
jgi:hypothetical protein